MNKAITAIMLVGTLFLSTQLRAQDETVDHFRYGFDLEGAHATVPCESCHVRGNFRGTPRDCAGCHDGSGLFAATGVPPNHIASTRQCDACHTTAAWPTLYEVDHTQTLGSCSSCHNGVQAPGKPLGHVQTSAECETCHNTTTWTAALFDHEGISSGCARCHNGSDATGKSPNHIQSSNFCEACHVPDFWEPAVLVDHAEVSGTCATCHNGITATGKDLGHIASSDQCDDCHSTTAWLPAVFDHASVLPGTCSSCHDGITATGKHAAHISTSSECDVCHSSLSWTPAGFDHQGVTGSCSTCHTGVQATGMPGNHFQTTQECDHCHTTDYWNPTTFVHTSAGYPGDHRGNLACTACHGGNAETVTWSFPAYAPDCAGCHANDYRTGPHRKTAAPETSYTVSELRDCTGACHMYTDSSQTTIDEFRPGPEHRVSAGEF